MFRNFYAKQNMEDPRDSWYKPNLLYNIHYRRPTPPTLPTQPKLPALPRLIVVTKESNPSVCTCGKHCCKPHYRMEREVVWSNREVRNEGEKPKEQIQLVKDGNVKAGEDDSSGEDIDNKSDAILESEEELKIIVSNGGVCNLEGKINGLKVIGKYEADVERKGSLAAGMQKLKERNKEEYSDDVNSKVEMQDYIADIDNDEFGSTFGIMRVFCESGVHTAWSATNGFHGY